MLIKEVILENFMSYEYARIPFKPGVNVICGPNGAGKSSILIGISVALGQSYTERSRKLSDLIRWGKDQARITLVLDNSRRGGKRPVSRFNKDEIYLTRVLRRDGKYWFELENRAATKHEVQRLLGRLGVDPDNMLLIMHQNMVEQFAVLSPQEKLKMVEAAVGLEPYRRNVLAAQKKLGRILSQEESVRKLLESAEQTLSYWREQYDRYQQKKQLQMKRRFLERELAWAKVNEKEAKVEELKSRINEIEEEIKRIENEAKLAKNELSAAQRKLQNLKNEWKDLLEERLLLEREKAKHELNLALSSRNLEEWRSIVDMSQNEIRSSLTQIESLESQIMEIANENPRIKELAIQLTEIKRAYKNLENMLIQHLNLERENAEKTIDSSKEQYGKISQRISELQAKIESLYGEIEKEIDLTVDLKIKLAILSYRKEDLDGRIKKLKNELKTAEAELKELTEKAEIQGPRIVPTKTIEEIIDEIRVTDGHLAALADVSEDIEKMYERYSRLYLELKEKARLVAENREKAMKEVETRMEAWRTVIEKLLDRVNMQYQAILEGTQATGYVKLINGNDIEAAGIEIFVGFRGAKPVPLNAYTQSGGERSTAIMAFLLALQQHVRSPFRAVDEYDIHMDEKNRELIANILVEAVKNLGVQYLVITPRSIVFPENVHVITVQNVEGTSIIKEVK